MTLVELAALAAEVLGLPTDEALRAIDLDALVSVQQAVAGAGSETLERAATLMVAVAQRRPLPRHNRRFAVLGATWLLEGERLALSFADGEPLGKLLASVEAGAADVATVRQVLFHDVVHREEGARMFERFTDRARRVLVLSQESARTLGHNFIGTEHLVLGMLREGTGVAAVALGELGVDAAAYEEHVRRRMPSQSATEGSSPPFTPRAKTLMELGLRESLKLGHTYIGTEHLLLGAVAEGEGIGFVILRDDFGLEPGAVVDEVMRLLRTTVSPPKNEFARFVELYRSDVERIEALSDEEDAALAEVIARGIDGAYDAEERIAAQGAVEKLIRGHLRDVLQVVMHLPPSGDPLSQIQEGNMALIAAAKEWRPAEHGPFPAFARERVAAALAPPAVVDPDAGTHVRCSFCGKPQKDVKKLIAGPSVFICDECVDLCTRIIEEDLRETDADQPPPLTCSGCKADLRTSARFVGVTIDAQDVKILTCRCGRVVSTA